jgi:hypothetical protein
MPEKTEGFGLRLLGGKFASGVRKTKKIARAVRSGLEKSMRLHGLEIACLTGGWKPALAKKRELRVDE